jgi:hypothetical protein
MFTKAITIHAPGIGHTQLLFARVASESAGERMEHGWIRREQELHPGTYCAQWSCAARRSGELLFCRTLGEGESPLSVQRVHGFSPGVHVLAVATHIRALDATRRLIARVGAEQLQQDGVLMRALPWLVSGIDPVWIKL